MEERYSMPDKRGYFGCFGGEYVPETLMYALEELEEGFSILVGGDRFESEYKKYLKDYIGRPSPLYYAASLSKKYDVKLYLKREDLNHTGSHKINNALGQVLLAKFLGKKRIIAETGAGQHGVATATACALLGLECHIYMGKVDIERQKLNASRIKLLGANLIAVESGSMTLKDALNEALRDWTLNVKTTHYVIGSVAGPKPFPKMVREFQKVIGQEAKEQIKLKEGCLPSKLIACVGGGSNAIGLFYEFLEDNVVMYGIEAGGEGLSLRGGHAATLTKGRVGILHGSKSYVLCDEYGQIEDVHSLAAGLDYPGVGPEHSYLKESKRVKYDTITDSEALIGFKMLSEMEGIIPAFESAHALGYMNKLESRMELERGELIIINLSGRGDKDII